MDELMTSSSQEMRISSKIVLATLVALSWMLALISQSLSEPIKARVEVLAILIAVLSAITWAVERRDTRLARWFIVIALLALILLAHYWLHLPGTLTWLVVPTVLAAALLSLAAATGVALFETALLFLLSLWGPGSATAADRGAIGVALGATFAVLGIVSLVYHSVYQTVGYSEAYFERARVLLEQTRDRKVELEQALIDLANANRQLALAGERMAALRIIAEEAQKAKTMFVAKVSHEFRTPLNMIIGLVSLMVESPEMYDVVLPPEMRSDLEVVYRNCVHLANMIK
jgi:signal transduction histidine kinase